MKQKAPIVCACFFSKMPGKLIAAELKQAIVSYWEYSWQNSDKNGGQGWTIQSLSDIFGV